MYNENRMSVCLHKVQFLPPPPPKINDWVLLPFFGCGCSGRGIQHLQPPLSLLLLTFALIIIHPLTLVAPASPSLLFLNVISGYF
jgi:hypothetical protein